MLVFEPISAVLLFLYLCKREGTVRVKLYNQTVALFCRGKNVGVQGLSHLELLASFLDV